MVIVHSSISYASACKGNKTRETLRFGPESLSEQRGISVITKERALIPQGVNSIRPRYTKMLTANLPEMAKPAANREEMNVCTCWVSRGDWRERVSKEYSWYPGDPSRCLTLVVRGKQRVWGSHNPVYLRRRKSERPIGVMTQGNACRAKGLYRYCVSKMKGGSA